MSSEPFKFTEEYRKSDEYKLFRECVLSHGVPEALVETAIMLHKADPFYYKKARQIERDFNNEKREPKPTVLYNMEVTKGEPIEELNAVSVPLIESEA